MIRFGPHVETVLFRHESVEFLDRAVIQLLVCLPLVGEDALLRLFGNLVHDTLADSREVGRFRQGLHLLLVSLQHFGGVVGVIDFIPLYQVVFP